MSEEKEKRSVYLPPPWADRQGKRRRDGGQEGERGPTAQPRVLKAGADKGPEAGAGAVLWERSHPAPKFTPNLASESESAGFGAQGQTQSCRQAGQGRGRLGG